MKYAPRAFGGSYARYLDARTTIKGLMQEAMDWLAKNWRALWT